MSASIDVSNPDDPKRVAIVTSNLPSPRKLDGPSVSGGPS